MTADQVSWVAFPLRSLCLDTTTTDPTKAPNASFEYVDVSAVSNELWKIISTTPHLGRTAPSRARKSVRAQDVIFATVRPTLKRVAIVPDHLDGQIVSTAFCVLRADPARADPSFIYYSLLTDDFIDRIGNLQRGASYPAVADSNVLDEEIPLPPLPEQRAIAAVLSKIQAAIEVQEKIVATLKELKAATMAKLFREGLRGEPLKQTEIGEIPESWEVVQLGSLTTQKITDGTHVTPIYVDEGVPFVTATNLTEDSIDLIGCKKISLEEHLKLTSRCKPERGDILLSKVGTLGLVAKVDTDIPFSIFVQVALIKVDHNKVNASYLKHALKSEMLQKRINNRASRSTMLYIGVGKIAELEIPIPSREKQEELLAVLDSLDARAATDRQRLAMLKSLFSSMLHLLMTSQVRMIGMRETT